MSVSTEASGRTFAGNSPNMGKRVWVHNSAVILGDLTLGDDVSIWPQVSIRADVNSVRVGARTNIQDGCVLHVSHKSEESPQGWPLDIGEDVTIGHSAVVHGCTVSDRVLIGMGAIVMDGVVVETEVVIAAGALVTPGKVLRSHYLYAGSPAREVRPLKDSEIAHFRDSAAHYKELKDRYLADSGQQTA